MSKCPMVTVLMSVYNGEKYLHEAIQSILSQTLQNFEFLIVNDASTDESLAIINSYPDSRIKLIHNEANLGLTSSLNKGLEIAIGKYIARMDSDDISLPTRLERQLAFMESHPEVGVCGTWVKLIGCREGEVWKFPTQPRGIKSRMIFESSLAHPSVMFRRRFLEINNLKYSYEWICAQDYELWTRCSDLCDLTNIDEVLMLYRIHSQQIGRAKSDVQKHYANLVRRRQVEKLVGSPGPEYLDMHYALAMWRIEGNREFLLLADDWLRNLFEANMKIRYYPEPEFSKVLAERWLAVCCAAEELGLWTWERFWSSPLSRWARSDWKHKCKYWVKRVIGKHQLPANGNMD